MITKTIHYCWFGRGELPEKAKQCIESWKKFCPDYEIKEWNEDNFDMNSCAYVKEAYELRFCSLQIWCLESIRCSFSIGSFRTY